MNQNAAEAPLGTPAAQVGRAPAGLHADGLHPGKPLNARTAGCSAGQGAGVTVTVMEALPLEAPSSTTTLTS